MGRFDAKRLLVEIYNEDEVREEVRVLLILFADWLNHTSNNPASLGPRMKKVNSE